MTKNDTRNGLKLTKNITDESKVNWCCVVQIRQVV